MSDRSADFTSIQQHIDTVNAMQAISPFMIFAVFDVLVLECRR